MRKTVDGLVIRECAAGESDKILTVLTSELGKISICAKGARSIKSKNLSVCRLFTYANFEYYEKNGRRWLASGSVIDSFFGLNSNMEGFALASYIVDVAGEISGENSADGELLRAVLNTLYAINKELRPTDLIKGAFEFFAASHSGFAPDTSHCSVCGTENCDAGFCLDVMNGSLLCSDCLSAKQKTFYAQSLSDVPEYDRFSTRNILIPLSAEVILAIRYASTAPVSRLFSFTLTQKNDVELFSKAGETYLQNHLERSFDTLDFYHIISTPVKEIKK